MKTLTLTLCAMILSQQAQAWSDSGHRMVGEIAQRNLSPKAKIQVSNLLGEEGLANASTWADEIKSDPEKKIEVVKRWPPSQKTLSLKENRLARVFHEWHYIDYPDDVSKISDLKRAKNGDIVAAIERMTSVLKNKSAPDKNRREALRLLAHFVGDIHQPLHVGNGLDRGGNSCWVNWFPDKYSKNIKPKPKKKNDYVSLHVLWDRKLFESRELSYMEYATRLNRPHPRLMSTQAGEVAKLESLPIKKLQERFSELKSQWQTASLHDWANESKNLRNRAYLGRMKSGGLADFCFKSFKTPIPSKNIPRISWNERYKLLRIAERRALQAGIRLAGLLNSIFE